MLSRDLGGMQQVFLDYNQILQNNDVEVVNVTAVCADINRAIVPDYTLPNIANWDFLSILYLKKIIRQTKPDVIIAHGGRATKFCYYAKKKSIPMVGIIHSGKLKWVDRCEYIVALTESMRKKAVIEGVAKERLIVLPNVVDTAVIPGLTRDPVLSKKIVILTQNTKNDLFMKELGPRFRGDDDERGRDDGLARNDGPPTIGTMARFVPKKGIDIFIRSLAILKEKNIEFEAIIGGSGDEEGNLKNLVTKLHLENEVRFVGWVRDKAEFFDSFDIFCAPSIEEPFGVILLEAMLYKKPIIAADSEGPREIITDMKDGVLVRKGSPEEMAKAIEKLLKNPDLAKSLIKKASLTVRERYDINVVGKKLIEFLKKIT